MFRSILRSTSVSKNLRSTSDSKKPVQELQRHAVFLKLCRTKTRYDTYYNFFTARTVKDRAVWSVVMRQALRNLRIHSLEWTSNLLVVCSLIEANKAVMKTFFRLTWIQNVYKNNFLLLKHLSERFPRAQTKEIQPSVDYHVRTSGRKQRS